MKRTDSNKKRTGSSVDSNVGSNKGRKRTKSPVNKSAVPFVVTMRDGKTTIRQMKGRRFVRFGEVRGKTLAYVELFTTQEESHSLSLHFQDRTTLYLLISPGFTINAEYFRNDGVGDSEMLKRWPLIRCE